MTPTRLVGTAAIALLAALSIARLSGRTLDAATSTHQGFELTAGKCDSGQVPCALRQPKSWTDEEIETVVSALTTWETEIARLEQANDYVGQQRLNRTLALKLRPFRVPTMDSIRGSAEAFADIASLLVLDLGARQDLPRATVRYFDTEVFALRAPARPSRGQQTKDSP